MSSCSSRRRRLDTFESVASIYKCSTHLLEIAMMTALIAWDKRLDRAGSAVARYGLVVIFVLFGLLKFTPQEAASIAPLVDHSPAFFWLVPWANAQTAGLWST